MSYSLFSHFRRSTGCQFLRKNVYSLFVNFKFTHIFVCWEVCKSNFNILFQNIFSKLFVNFGFPNLLHAWNTLSLKSWEHALMKALLYIFSESINKFFFCHLVLQVEKCICVTSIVSMMLWMKFLDPFRSCKVNEVVDWSNEVLI